MRFASFSVLVLCLSTRIKIKADSAKTDDELELLFRQRSHSDWEDVWHQETHSRCRNKLMRHIYWACEKDIYRISRRSGPKTLNKINVDLLRLSNPTWLNTSVDNTLLRVRRTRHVSGPSITRECCTKVGCTWEEYAEYCPSNKRKNHFF